jgi:hypothetical protein
MSLLLASKHTARFASNGREQNEKRERHDGNDLHKTSYYACDDCSVLLLHCQPVTALALAHGPKKMYSYVSTDRIITYQQFQHDLKSAKEQNLDAMLQVTPQNKALQ